MTPPDSIHVLTCEQAIALVCDSPWPMGVLTPDGKFDYVNLAFAACLGCNGRRELIVDTQHGDWVHPDDAIINNQLAKEIASGTLPGFQNNIKYKVRGPAGVYQWGLLNVTGVWVANEFTGYHIQFMPVNGTIQNHGQWLTASKIKEIAKWMIDNKGTVTMIAITVVSIISALTRGNWQELLEILSAVSPEAPDLPPQP